MPSPSERTAALGVLGRLRGAVGRSDRTLFLAACGLLLPLYLAPLAVTPLLPGLDLPFHLAIADA